MSLDFWQNKIPSEYASQITAREGSRSGYYVGNEKIADLYGTTTSQLRSIMEQRDANRRAIIEEQMRQERISQLNSQINSIIDNATSNLNNARNRLNNSRSELNTLESNYNSIISSIGNDNSIQKYKNRIEQDYSNARNKINNKIASDERKINEQLSLLNNLRMQARNTRDENTLKTILYEARNNNYNLTISDINIEIMDINNAIKNTNHIKEIERNVNQLNKTIKNTRFEAQYSEKFNKALNNVNISNRNTILELERLVNEIQSHIDQELQKAKTNQKSLESELVLQNALNSIYNIKRAVKNTLLQDYSEQFVTIQKQFDSKLSEFKEVQELDVATKRNEIVTNFGNLTNPNTFSNSDYMNCCNLIEKLTKLNEFNNSYNDKKSKFDEHYLEFKRTASNYGLEIEDIAFDYNNADQQIIEMNAALKELNEYGKQKQLEISKSSLNDYFTKNGYTELESEQHIDELSYRKVFYKKENPFVVTVLDISNSNNIIVHSHPVIAQNSKGYVYEADSEQLRKKLKKNCLEANKASEGEESISKSDEVEEIIYYTLSKESSNEYLKDINFEMPSNATNNQNGIVMARALNTANDVIKTTNSKDKQIIRQLTVD